MNGPFYGEGKYVGQVIDQALGETKTGKPQFVLKCTILGTPADDGSYNPVPQQYDRTIYMVLTEATMPYVVEKLATLGFAGKSFAQLDPEHASAQKFIGNQVDLRCKHENDQSGQPREKWDIGRASSGLEVKPLESKKVRELDALFGRALANGFAKTAPAPKRSTPVAVAANGPGYDSSEITDDDIPF